MDRIATFIQDNLNGYNLPADDLVEIRAVLLRRFGEKFSEGLSPEGRKAMEQAAKREVESAASLYRMKGGPHQHIIDTHTTNDNENSSINNSSFIKKNDINSDNDISVAI